VPLLESLDALAWPPKAGLSETELRALCKELDAQDTLERLVGADLLR
jgi:hypothetical protein